MSDPIFHGLIGSQVCLRDGRGHQSRCINGPHCQQSCSPPKAECSHTPSDRRGDFKATVPALVVSPSSCGMMGVHL